MFAPKTDEPKVDLFGAKKPDLSELGAPSAKKLNLGQAPDAAQPG